MKMTKEFTPRILQNVCLVPHHLEFNLNTRISTAHFHTFDFPLLEDSDEYLKAVGPIGAKLVRRINDILGCESISLYQYGVHVIVGDAFDPDRDGITDAVIEALRNCFGEKRDEVETVINKGM